MSTMTERDYVLGTHDEEVARLKLQHVVWRSRALDAFRRAGFTAGQTLLDIGCGPGFATSDLADIVGDTGRVVALDRSQRFLEVLRARNLQRVQVHNIDFDEDELPARDADGAWARWIFAFVKRPRDLVSRVSRALKPGGVFVIHEYVDYSTWRVRPHSPEHDEFVRAVMKTWRDAGGEPDIGFDLPNWLEELAFEVRSLRPIIDIIRHDDFTWQWPRAFMRSGLSRLVDLGEISAERSKAMEKAFAAIEANPQALMITPAVLEIIAAKR